MNFKDKAFLLNKNKYNENSVVAEFFTENNGKVSGILFGATSKKLKIFINWKSISAFNLTLKIRIKLDILKSKLKKYLPHIIWKIKLNLTVFCIH